MPLEAETPSSVMYGCLKQFASIKNNELARILFAETFIYGGKPLVDRLGERTFLSRTVVRSKPGDFSERAFSPFTESAQTVVALMSVKYPGLSGKHVIIDYLSGEACEAMCASLRALGLNDTLYRNITSRVKQMELSNLADKATLLALQFITTGCLGDPTRATEITQEFSRHILNSSFRTAIAQEGDPISLAASTQDSHFGLCRIVNGKIRMPTYPLRTDSEGTEIGSLTTAPGAINDVGRTVSRRHLLIFRDESGRWWAQGLGSTNGTVVIRGDSKEEQVIEAPRSQREPNAKPEPVQLFPSDTIRLADTTEFMVLEITE